MLSKHQERKFFSVRDPFRNPNYILYETSQDDMWISFVKEVDVKICTFNPCTAKPQPALSIQLPLPGSDFRRFAGSLLRNG